MRILKLTIFYNLKTIEVHSVLQAMRHMEASLSTVSRSVSDCSVASKLQAMKRKTEEQVRFQRSRATYLVNLAVRTAQKNFHCLSMRLTAEYFALRPEERKLPNENKIHHPELYHYVVFSDNVLACAVVVNSTVSTAKVNTLLFHMDLTSTGYGGSFVALVCFFFPLPFFTFTFQLLY